MDSLITQQLYLGNLKYHRLANLIAMGFIGKAEDANLISNSIPCYCTRYLLKTLLDKKLIQDKLKEYKKHHHDRLQDIYIHISYSHTSTVESNIDYPRYADIDDVDTLHINKSIVGEFMDDGNLIMDIDIFDGIAWFVVLVKK